MMLSRCLVVILSLLALGWSCAKEASCPAKDDKAMVCKGGGGTHPIIPAIFKGHNVCVKWANEKEADDSPNTEAEVYKLCDNVANHPLCGVIPRSGGICEIDGKIHIIMENLREHIPLDDEKKMKPTNTFDAKIGFRTATSQDSDSKKRFRQKFIDSMLSQSSTKGYRFEHKKGGLQMRKYTSTIAEFFESDRTKAKAIASCIFGPKQLQAVHDAVKTTYAEKTMWKMVGASVLCITAKDGSGCVCRIIDFGHTWVKGGEKLEKYQRYFYGGFMNMLCDLADHAGNGDHKWVTDACKNYRQKAITEEEDDEIDSADILENLKSMGVPLG